MTPAFDSPLRLERVDDIRIDAAAYEGSKPRTLRLITSEQIPSNRVDEESLREILRVRRFLMVVRAHVRIDRRPIHGRERVLRARPYIGIGAADAPYER